MNAIDRLPRISADAAAAIKLGAPMYGELGASLYGSLCEQIPDDPELVAFVSQGLVPAPVLHLFTSVQYLLLRYRNDPLAQYYATLTERPAPPELAFPHFARFCKEHRGEILELINTRTIQTTDPDRCKMVMPLLSHIADRAGEPLNVIEIGCSAGVLLAFDKYAYDFKGRSTLGPKNASLTLSGEVRGGPALHIPKIGKRIGVDLCPIDARLEDERDWILSHLHPEALERRKNLAIALNEAARSEISFFKGDGMDLVPELAAKTRDPLCIYHSACLVFWTPEAKAQLDSRLREVSRGREFFRVGLEPVNRGAKSGTWIPLVEISIAHYRDGAVDTEMVAQSTGSYNALVEWIE